MKPIDVISTYRGAEQSGTDALGFSLAGITFQHARFKSIVLQIAERHHHSSTHGVSDGLLITGFSGVGKSKILRHYQSLFPRRVERGVTIIPALFAETQSSPTVKSLAQTILGAIGDPTAHRGTAAEKTERIYNYFARCGIEILLLDEFHHFYYTATVQQYRDITDWLKGIMNNLRCTLVLCGLPEAKNVVRSNSQLWRRFSSQIELSPFAMDDAEDWLEFRGLLQAFGAQIPVPFDVPLHESNMARRVYIASGGRLDYVKKLLEGAISVAVRTDLPSIDLAVLAAGFREQIWSDVPTRLNPFHPESPLRPLNRSGEPFEPDSHAQMIGSPIARRLGGVLRKTKRDTV
jgi:type II secretory pathway predicted ATPase ExeA